MPDYRDEPWAREVLCLPTAERAARTAACETLLQAEPPAISDALYSELLVYLEVITGRDQASGTSDPGQPG